MVIDDYPVSAGEPFEFEWQIDSHGYGVVVPAPKEDDGVWPQQATVLTGGLDKPFIARLGGPLRGYRPLEEVPGLFLEFANTEATAEAAVAFTNLYGPLGSWHRNNAEKPQSESLQDWMDRQLSLRRMVAEIEARLCKGEPISDLAGLYNRHFHPRMTVRLDERPGRRIHLRVVPNSLFGAMLLQVALQISSGTRFKQCKACPTWFPYGLGTVNRKTKVFCSSRCRVAWNRQQKRESSL